MLSFFRTVLVIAIVMTVVRTLLHALHAQCILHSDSMTVDDDADIRRLDGSSVGDGAPATPWFSIASWLCAPDGDAPIGDDRLDL